MVVGCETFQKARYDPNDTVCRRLIRVQPIEAPRCPLQKKHGEELPFRQDRNPQGNGLVQLGTGLVSPNQVIRFLGDRPLDNTMPVSSLRLYGSQR